MKLTGLYLYNLGDYRLELAILAPHPGEGGLWINFFSIPRTMGL